MPKMTESVDSELMTALQEIEDSRCSDALARLEHVLQREMTFEQRVSILLTKGKCLLLLGQFHDAKQVTSALKDIDREERFRLDREFLEILISSTEGDASRAVQQAESVFATFRDKLRTPEYEDHDYELRMRTAIDLVFLKRFSEAIPALEAFLPRAKGLDTARIHLFLGIAFEFSGDDRRAVSNFEAALKTHEEDVLARAHYHLGAQHLKRNALAWSKQHFQATEALKEALNFPVRDLYLFLSKVCDRLGEAQEAKRYLRLSQSS